MTPTRGYVLPSAADGVAPREHSLVSFNGLSSGIDATALADRVDCFQGTEARTGLAASPTWRAETGRPLIPKHLVKGD